MTKAGNRAVVRETQVMRRSRSKSRPIIISIEQGGWTIGFRLKGERRAFRLPTDWCFMQVVDAYVTAEKAKRQAERRAMRIAS